MVKVEEGKFYKTRDGRKARVTFVSGTTADIEVDDCFCGCVFVENGMADIFPKTGKGREMHHDLVEEWKEEKMPKFKVGDFVTVDGWLNPNGSEIKKIDDKAYWLSVTGELFEYPFYYWDDKLKLVSKQPKSPVVEKVVKSIEPGVYGIVNVPPNPGRISLIPKARDYTPDELESAAKTFMELAKYLREKE